MAPTSPLRPDVLETVLFDPDRQDVLAVLPGGLWLSPGDIVELDDPPRDGRVLSTRLQLRDGQARVLVIVDVPDDGADELRGAEPTEVALAAEVDEPDNGLSAELDRDLDAVETGIEGPSP